MTPEQEKLITDNMRLVPHLAKQFSQDIEVIEELVGEGHIALVEASLKFNESKGTAFPTYAGVVIRNKMIKYLNSLPEGNVSFESIVNSEGLTLFDTLEDPLAVNTEKELLKQELMGSLKEGMSRLSARDSWIVKRYFGVDGGNPMSYEEIGEYIGLSTSGVSKIIKKSLEFLNNYLKKS